MQRSWPVHSLLETNNLPCLIQPPFCFILFGILVPLSDATCAAFLLGLLDCKPNSNT
eukprot:NODE_1633_length_887_cov_63.182578_g1277_i0.p4 GENE.NODE_1633_length_887_cov_63.182578_g1277_i0~~NODE_1633_length_887_cov_63.182578_g1277_i0.p4  ORF type:complete len:57 (-),score=1.95 NODE_1633_length_887_cov_63.182578_g1277_i0:312-482(-)